MKRHARDISPPPPSKHCFSTSTLVLVLAMWLCVAPRCLGQTPAGAKAGSDLLVFTNGDSIRGTLLSATASKVVFHSDMAGDLTLDWSNVKTINAEEQFAVIRNGVKLSRKTPQSDVAQGSLAVAEKSVEVKSSSGSKTVLASELQVIVPDAAFQNILYHEPGLLHGYTGALTLGAALVEATENVRTFNGGLTLIRSVPNASWVSPRNKTTLDANAIYGSTTQSATSSQPSSSTKTNILHGDLERDEYLNTRFYYLGYLSADHDYSQGLAVQQVYGGGVGYTALKSAQQELDLKVDIHYEQQSFIPSGVANRNLIGLDFGETYTRKLRYGLGLNETGLVTPAFNDTSAFSAAFAAALTFPVYRNLGFNLGASDNYLNDPPPTFNNNSFQFTAGLTYAFK